MTLPTTSEVKDHIDSMLLVNNTASDMPYNIAAEFNLSSLQATIHQTVQALLTAGEPYRALLFLSHCIPTWAETESTHKLIEDLTSKVKHCDDWATFVQNYSAFSTSAPGNGPLMDRGLLSIDRYPKTISRLRQMKPTTVLNIGCGDGTFDDAVLSCCPSIRTWVIADIGDVSAIVTKLRERHPGISISSHRVTKSVSDWPTENYDLVLATEVLEHVFDQESFVEACFARSEHVVVSTPDASHWFHAEKTDTFIQHVRANTPQSLVDLFAHHAAPLWLAISRERSIVAHFKKK